MFIGAVTVLIVNDWVLKQAVGGWWTGKLSDVAGLFAFAVFLSALDPHRRKALFGLLALAFMLWKSPLSEPALQAWNAWGVWPLRRVVDYSDWLALVALVPAYQFVHQPRPTMVGRVAWTRLAAITIATVSVVAFAASSRAPPSYPVPSQETFHVRASRQQVRATLKAFGWYHWPRRTHALPDTLFGSLADSADGVSLSVELRDSPECGTMLMPTELRAWRAPDWPTIRKRLLEQVIEPLRAVLPAC